MSGRHVEVARNGHGERWIGIGGVILIHFLLVAFLLSGLTRFAVAPHTPQEIFFSFLPAAQQLKPEKPRKKIAPRRTETPPLSRYPSLPRDIYSVPVPETKGPTFHLFDCGAENYSNLDAEQRSHCSEAFASHLLPDSASGMVKEHALEAGRWSASIASRNTPVAVPCANLRKVITDPVTGKADTAAMVDPVCATRDVLRALGH